MERINEYRSSTDASDNVPDIANMARTVDKNHFPDDKHYRSLLAIGLWAVARHGVVMTDFLVLGFVPEDSYSCQIVILTIHPRTG